MLHSVGRFVDDVAVSPAGPGRYRCDLSGDWNLVAVPHGGVIVAVALRAAGLEVGSSAHQLRTCTTVFAGQVASGPLDVEVQVLRLGRSATQVLATVANEGAGSGATWLRFDEPPRLADGTLDPLGLVTLTDRMPGCIGERLGHRGRCWFAPSADLTVHLLEPLRTEWVLAHDRAWWADDGWASAETHLWDEQGVLVAYATQMMLFTYLEE